MLDHAGCNLVVVAGSATLTDSAVEGAGEQACLGGAIDLTEGSVSLVRTWVLDPAPSMSAVRMSGGTFTADQSLFDDSARDVTSNNSDGIHVLGGTATVTRSTFRGWGFQAIQTGGGSTAVSDSTFLGNLVGVNGDSGTVTVVRSTFENELASLQGTVSVARSVLGSTLGGPPLVGIQECNGTITDLGYNLSADHSVRVHRHEPRRRGRPEPRHHPRRPGRPGADRGDVLAQPGRRQHPGRCDVRRLVDTAVRGHRPARRPAPSDGCV